LCLRVTLSVFLSILIVEAVILVPSFKNYERDLLRRLEDTGAAAFGAGLGNLAEPSSEDVRAAGEAILRNPRIGGAALYDGSGAFIGGFGEAPELTPAGAYPPERVAQRQDDGARYEVMWPGTEIGLPFTVVGRMNASWIDGELVAFLWRIAGLVLLISVFVSGIAILILGRLILGPVLELRSTMVAARDDPANADRYMLETSRSDELGDMVEALNNLLHSVSQAHRDEVRAREERFRDFAGAASDWFWEMDEDLRFSYFSQRFEEVTGVSPEALLGKRREDTGIAASVDPEAWRSHLDDLEAGRSFRGFVHPRELGDGTVVQLSINGKPFFDEAGNFKGYRGTGSDITAEIEARREAEKARTLLTEAIEALADAFALFDADDRLVLCNSKFRENYLTYMGIEVPTGATMEEMMRAGLARGAFPEAVGNEEAWMAERLARHRQEESSIEQRLGDGTWMRVTERRTEDGGTVGVRTDITELKARQAELGVARDQAEAANRAKSEFLANMSHELRTPLNAVIGFSDMIINGTLGPDRDAKILEYARDINNSGQHLLDVINDILDLSKIEAGKFELHEGALDMEQAISSVLKIIGVRLREAGLGITIEIADDLPKLFADQRALKQISLNLLSNAVKFTTEGGRVTVRAAIDEEGAMLLAVSDTGIGIPAKDIEKALAPFGQVDSIFTRKFPGTGLGLPLVRSLVELHGGNLSIESLVGVGTTATVRFPGERVIWPRSESDAVSAAS
jgi:PAS domain S-box-containing protein